MNGVDLFLLGRTLMKIGEAALPTEEATGGHRPVLIVLDDVVTHPESTISEVARRTSLPQSAVSTAVARLHEAGSLTLETDQRDRRRTIVRPASGVSRRVRQIRATTINSAIGDAIAADDPSVVEEIVGALETVARQLLPDRASAR